MYNFFLVLFIWVFVNFCLVQFHYLFTVQCYYYLQVYKLHTVILINCLVIILFQFRPRSSSQGSQPEPNNKIFYGSEPDLRFTSRDYQSYNNDSPAKLRISRSRKKYKAPPAPQNNNCSNNTGVSSKIIQFNLQHKVWID